jgi:hypothetical protein
MGRSYDNIRQSDKPTSDTATHKNVREFAARHVAGLRKP